MDCVQVEYEIILQESDAAVTFQINGIKATVSRISLIKFDYEGRLWITKDTAESLGLPTLEDESA